MGLWSLELLWKGRKEAQTFDIFYLQMSYTSSQLISQVPSCSIASLKKFNYFPWVQYFIQISGGILFSPEEKIFVWKLWVLVGSKCRFKFFSLYLLFFFFFAASQNVAFILGGRIACGTLGKLWLYAIFEICLGLLPRFELLKWVKQTAHLGKYQIPVSFFSACFFNITQYFKTLFFCLQSSWQIIWFSFFV